MICEKFSRITIQFWTIPLPSIMINYTKLTLMQILFWFVFYAIYFHVPLFYLSTTQTVRDPSKWETSMRATILEGLKRFKERGGVNPLMSATIRWLTVEMESMFTFIVVHNLTLIDNAFVAKAATIKTNCIRIRKEK